MQDLKLKKVQGFTLIELMVVMAIVGIISAFAIPSYSEYVRRGKRAEAKATLSSAQSALEKCFQLNRTYFHSPTTPCTISETLAGGGLPTERKNYVIKFSNNLPSATNKTAYTLLATRTSSMVNDKCGDFTIDQIGNKGILNNDANATLATCWDK